MEKSKNGKNPRKIKQKRRIVVVALWLFRRKEPRRTAIWSGCTPSSRSSKLWQLIQRLGTLLRTAHCESYQCIVSHDSALWVISAHCESYQLIVSHISSLWVMLAHCESYELIVSHISSLWVISAHCESCQCTVSHVSSLWVIWAYCEPYQLIVSHISSLWVISAHCESYHLIQCDATRSEDFLRKCVFIKYAICEFLGIDISWQSMLFCSSWFCGLFTK